MSGQTYPDTAIDQDDEKIVDFKDILASCFCYEAFSEIGLTLT